MIRKGLPDAAVIFASRDGLRVIITLDDCEDKGLWLHVSVSRHDRYPTWEEIKDTKDAFIGRDKLAVQFLPAAKDYVNIHQNCFHLWHVLDKDIFPDLS